MKVATVVTASATAGWFSSAAGSLRAQGPLRYFLMSPPSAPPQAARGWGTLDVYPSVLDLSAVETIHVPHLLCDVRRMQRLHGPYPVPLILLDEQDVIVQQLLACSDVIGVGATTHVPLSSVPDILAVLAEMDIDSSWRPAMRTWIGMTPQISPVLQTPYWIPMLAALALAPTMPVAVEWSGCSHRTVYRTLDTVRSALQISSDIRLRPDHWTRLILDYLAHPAYDRPSLRV